MTREQKALLELVSIGASGECCFSDDVLSADWSQLFKLAQQQGMITVAWRAIEILYSRDVNACPVAVKLQWYAAAQQQMKAVSEHRIVIEEFAREFGMPFIVMKGLDYARFWPKAEWRGFGDLDVWALPEFQVSGFKFQTAGLADSPYAKFNERAREKGCRVKDDGYYKHSKIVYKNLTIENHLYLTMHDDTRTGKYLEKVLQRIVAEGEKTPLMDGALSPCREFTAIFLLVHAHQHFFFEGFSFRQILDWYFFLAKEGEKVKWDEVMPVLEKARIRGFYDVMTEFCLKHLGLIKNCSKLLNVVPDCKSDLLNELTVAVFDNQLEGDKASHLVHRFKRMWKFRSFLGESFFVRLRNTLVYNRLHKKPTLE